MIFYIGAKGVTELGTQSQSASYELLATDFKGLMQRNKFYGSTFTQHVSIPIKVETCFVDLDISPDMSSTFCKSKPVLCDFWNDQVSNFFVYDPNLQYSGYIGNISVDGDDTGFEDAIFSETTGHACYTGDQEFIFEGKGKHTFVRV